MSYIWFGLLQLMLYHHFYRWQKAELQNQYTCDTQNPIPNSLNFFFWGPGPGGGGWCIAVFRFISDIGPALGMDIEVPRYYRDWSGNIGFPIKSQYRAVLPLLAGPT